jgi:hypothetical protein
MALAPIVRAQDVRIGVVDFYGLRHVSENAARQAFGIPEGAMGIVDGMPVAALDAAVGRVRKVRGVRDARTEIVCCNEGRVIVFVGVEEDGAPTVVFRPAPRGDVRLANKILELNERLSVALEDAARRGTSSEDRSTGHALADDSSARAIQQQFIAYAARHRTQIREVTRRSSDSAHRALAAELLGYAPVTQSVVDDLMYATADSSSVVRNNATRALGVLASFASSRPDVKIHVSTAPFVALLNSPAWTDRNKAAMLLVELSRSRPPDLLACLRAGALDALIEMARWRSPGHANAPFWLLGRVAGLTDTAIDDAWKRHDPERLVAAARAAR